MTKLKQQSKDFWLFHPGLKIPERGMTGRYRPTAEKDINGEPMIEVEFMTNQFIKEKGKGV